MANLTTNCLIVCGEPGDVDEVKELLEGEKSNLEFENVVPMPDGLDPNDSKNGDTTRSVWGGYGAYPIDDDPEAFSDYIYKDEPGYVVYSFSTPNYCPWKVIDRLGALFPNVRIFYLYGDPASDEHFVTLHLNGKKSTFCERPICLSEVPDLFESVKKAGIEPDGFAEYLQVSACLTEEQTESLLAGNETRIKSDAGKEFVVGKNPDADFVVEPLEDGSLIYDDWGPCYEGTYLLIEVAL